MLSIWELSSWILAGLSLFSSLWIVIPAPNLRLFPLTVAAPELSPILVIINVIAIGLILAKLHLIGLYQIPLIAVSLALGLSLLPLVQFPGADARIHQQFQTLLGEADLKQISPQITGKFRAQTFNLIDLFRGIPIAEARSDRNIVFASPDKVNLTLNLYRPLENGPHPTLIIIYGGAWQRGSPHDYESFSRYIANQGYTVITLDYRHAPEYKFPAQIEDIQAGFRYIQTYAERLDVDLSKIAIMGRSAGAHLAMLYAYHFGDIPIQGVINYYSPVDLTEGYYDLPFPDPIQTRTVLETFLGGTPETLPQLYQTASPRHYLKPNLPPSLLVYPRRDRIVQAKFGKNLHTQLQTLGNTSIFLDIPWAEHAFDTLFNGISNQFALYYTERFLAWVLR